VRERRVAIPKFEEAWLFLPSTLNAFALVFSAIVAAVTLSRTLRVSFNHLPDLRLLLIQRSL
jgi:hypothetical protein